MFRFQVSTWAHVSCTLYSYHSIISSRDESEPDFRVLFPRTRLTFSSSDPRAPHSMGEVVHQSPTYHLRTSKSVHAKPKNSDPPREKTKSWSPNVLIAIDHIRPYIRIDQQNSLPRKIGIPIPAEKQKLFTSDWHQGAIRYRIWFHHVIWNDDVYTSPGREWRS